VSEPDARRFRDLLSEGIVATCRLSEVEVASALSRSCREGAFPVEERDRALAALHHDFATLFIVELGPEIAVRAVSLLTRLALRAADSVQLASCLELRDQLGEPCLFVCADDRLVAAARQEGLATAS
jgi:predicted nucleic acid-binding protein